MFPLNRSFPFNGGLAPSDPRSDPLTSPGEAARIAAADLAGKTLDSLIIKNKQVMAQEAQKQQQAKEAVAWQQRLEQVTNRTNKAIIAGEKGKMKDLRALAKSAGSWDPQRGFAFFDEKAGIMRFLTEKEFQESLENSKKGAEKAMMEVQKVKSQMVTNLTMDPTKPVDDHKGFSVLDILSSLAMGNPMAAVGELLQPFGGGEGWGQRLIERGEQKAAEASTLKGRLGGKLLAGAGRFVGPAGIVAAIEINRRATRFAQENIRAGQVTGEGFGAGLATMGETMGLMGNPWDMMDRRTAREIVMGVRGKGFKGEVGKALQDSIGTVFKDLGTEWQGTLEMLNVVVRNNVMSVEEFTKTMTNLDEVAKETEMSVQTVQDALKGVIDIAGQKGGRGAIEEASRQFPGMVKAFEGTTLTSEQIASVLQGGQAARAATFGGVPLWLGNMPEAQRLASKYMDELMAFLESMYTTNGYPNVDTFASFLITSGMAEQYLPGITDVAQLADFLDQTFKDRKKGITFTSRVEEERIRRIESINIPNLKREGGGKAHSQGTAASIDQEGKAILQSIHQDLKSVGLGEPEINQLMKDIRRPIFNPGDMTALEQRSALKEALEKFKPRAEQIIRVQVDANFDLNPNGSRYLEQINSARNAHIFKGKGSQGTQPIPPMNP